MEEVQTSTESLALVRTLAELVHAYQYWSAAKIPTDGLTPARMRVLLFLRETGSSPMRDIKDRCGTSATNITGLVDSLAAEGLVTRAADPNDRRVTRITLTHEGERRCRTEWAAYEAHCAATFANLDLEKQLRLLQALTEMQRLLTSNNS